MLLAQCLAVPAVAADKAEWRDWPLGQRLNFSLSGYRPRLDTKLTAAAGFDADNAIFGEINFEDQLGLDKRETTMLVGLDWRVSKRNSLVFNYYRLDRAAIGEPSVTFRIRVDGEDFVFGPGPGLIGEARTNLDIKVYEVAYNYALLFDEKKRWTLGIGLSWQDIFLIIGTADDFADATDVDVEAPLPTLNTAFSYAINDKWLLDLSLGWLDLKLDSDTDDDQFEGKIFRWDAGVRWQTWQNAGFSLGWTQFDVRAQVLEENLGGRIDYKYRGPRLGVNVYF